MKSLSPTVYSRSLLQYLQQNPQVDPDRLAQELLTIIKKKRGLAAAEKDPAQLRAALAESNRPSAPDHRKRAAVIVGPAPDTK